jgi:hypothetical protein
MKLACKTNFHFGTKLELLLLGIKWYMVHLKVILLIFFLLQNILLNVSLYFIILYGEFQGQSNNKIALQTTKV